MISGHGTIRDAVDATRSGAFDFLEKPLARDRVLLVTKNAIERSDLQRENQRFRELVGEAPKMIGRSAAFRQAVEQATQVARSDVSVLLLGESGTGKELLAAHVHRESPFASGPFVKVNCAAIPTELIESELFGHEKGAFTGAASLRRGRFELADGGTIFLDEVGDLHEASQAKLLRILQDGELQRVGGEQPIRVSVRVISATNRRLDELVAAGSVPRGSLLSAERRADPRAGASRARGRTSASSRRTSSPSSARATTMRPREIDPDVVPVLERYHWPGNVRELRNVVERMAILTRGRSPHRRSRFRSRSGSPSRRARRPACRRCATPPSASASARRWIRRTGTSPAPRACSAPSGRACTSDFARSDSSARGRVSSACYAARWRTAGLDISQPSATATAPTPTHIAAATSHTSARNVAPVAIGVNQKIVLAVSIPCISVVTSRLSVPSYTQTMSTRYAVKLATAARMDSVTKTARGIPPRRCRR